MLASQPLLARSCEPLRSTRVAGMPSPQATSLRIVHYSRPSLRLRNADSLQSMLFGRRPRCCRSSSKMVSRATWRPELVRSSELPLPISPVPDHIPPLPLHNQRCPCVLLIDRPNPARRLRLQELAVDGLRRADLAPTAGEVLSTAAIPTAPQCAPPLLAPRRLAVLDSRRFSAAIRLIRAHNPLLRRRRECAWRAAVAALEAPARSRPSWTRMRTRAPPAGRLSARAAAQTRDLAVAAPGCSPSSDGTGSCLRVPPCPPQVPSWAAIDSSVAKAAFHLFSLPLEVCARRSNPSLIVPRTIDPLALHLSLLSISHAPARLAPSATHWLTAHASHHPRQLVRRRERRHGHRCRAPGPSGDGRRPRASRAEGALGGARAAVCRP